MAGTIVRLAGWCVPLGAVTGLAALGGCLWIAAAAAADGAQAALPPTAASTTAGAKAEACSGLEHHEFDFWLGRWDVTEAGRPAGTNRIERLFGSCALHESWVGVEGMHGQSFNVYDRARGLWHQTWIDDRGSLLLLEGGLRAGSMVLEGTRPASGADAAHGAPVRHRITWTPLPAGTVRQHWQMSRDEGRTWETAFDGLYRHSR